MFRSLFRRSRAIRVPVEEGASGHRVREVKLYRRSTSKPSNFVTTFLVTYFVFRLVESYTSQSDNNKTKNKNEWEKWRKERGLNSEQQPSQNLSEHWKRAHEAIEKSDPRKTSKAAHGTESGASGRPPDVIFDINLGPYCRERPGALYTPSDQEFKDYVKVQSDQKKVTALKRQVAEMAAARLNTHAHRANLHNIGFNGHLKASLDLVPQLFPTLYEVPTIIVFRDGIGWGWKEVPTEVGQRFRSILQPIVTFNAATAAIKAFFHVCWVVTKAKASDGDVSLDIKQHVPYRHGSNKKEFEEVDGVRPLSEWPTNTKSVQDWLRAVHDGRSTRETHSELLKNIPFSAAVQWSAAVFRRQQLIGLAHRQQTKSRGTIQVRGHIECMGETGKYHVDVCAFYQPSEDKFVGHLLMSNAYIVKDYSLFQRVEDKKKRKLLDSQHERQQSGQETTTEEQEVTQDKPRASKATGKEKE